MHRMCLIFATVPSTLSVWFSYAMEVLLRVARSPSTEFAMKWSTYEEIHYSGTLLLLNRPRGQLLSGIFVVDDGGQMPWAAVGEINVQNAYWEG